MPCVRTDNETNQSASTDGAGKYRKKEKVNKKRRGESGRERREEISRATLIYTDCELLTYPPPPPLEPSINFSAVNPSVSRVNESAALRASLCPGIN